MCGLASGNFNGESLRRSSDERFGALVTLETSAPAGALTFFCSITQTAAVAATTSANANRRFMACAPVGVCGFALTASEFTGREAAGALAIASDYKVRRTPQASRTNSEGRFRSALT